MSFNFVVDKVVRNKAYPTLAKWEAEPYTPEWRQFGKHWPYTIPCELIEHCKDHGVEHKVYTLHEDYPADSYYAIGIGFFDFTIDYFALLSDDVYIALQDKKLRVLFYYHEGDNPHTIKERLDTLCLAWNLDADCYRFVSGNTVANNISGFAYFPDHELLYWRRNKVEPTPIHDLPRGRDFTVLSRTHKYWRATAMTDLWRNDILDNSYWSYNIELSVDEDEKDNPIEVDSLSIREDMEDFLKGAPYRCDNMTEHEHNDHSLVETAHYTNSYCNIILETHFDADGSSGTFLTEKTFKAIKHGQPFVIVGPPGSLATLRRLGYKTFDNAIDNSYDKETNNTERWNMIVSAIKKIKKHDLKKWFTNCSNDVKHNQQLFVSNKANRLNNLLERLKK